MLDRYWPGTTRCKTTVKICVWPLRDFLNAVGEGTVVLPTFTCDYGYNISLGRNVFINYHCIFLDCAPIAIGDDVQIGPAVQLYTAQHPIDPDIRRSGLESASPIRIAHDVWIGGGRWCCPASPSVLAAWSVQEVWWFTTCRQERSSLGIRPAL